jgi:hypothetical protein
MNRISISDLKSQDTLFSFKDEKSSLKSSLISAAVDRSINARKISGGCTDLTWCGGRIQQSY